MRRGWPVRAWHTPVAAATIASLGCRTAASWSAIAPDHRTTVTVSARGGKSCVAVAERADGCFDGLALHTLAFDASGAHVAYAARVGDRWAIIQDGRRGPAWNGVGQPRLSRNGDRLAYPALEHDRWRVVVDGIAGEPFDAIFAGTLTFDPTGRRLVYAASRGDSVHVVVDGVRSRGWSGVGRLVFDDDGKHVAYAARQGARWHVVVDGLPEPEHDDVREIVLGAASTSRGDTGASVRVAYAARDGGTWRVISDGIAGAPFDGVRALTLPPNVDAVTYVARLGAREGVVRGTHFEGWHDGVESVAFSPDGPWGYIARDRDSASVIVDGKVATRTDWAATLAFGRDARLAYLVTDGNRTAVVDERARYAFDIVVTGTLQFVHDGTVWACLAGDRSSRQLFVVVDGRPVGQPFDWSEIVRLMRDGDGASVIRAWVVAEAERVIRLGLTRPD